MSYLKKPSLLQQQELQEFVNKRLEDEESKVKERVYQWLEDNQYFTDNELFDFYFCVAQNIAAVEVLGGSGEKIVKAKNELEQSTEAYKTQIVSIKEQLDSQFRSFINNQQKLDIKLIQILEELNREHQNLKTISTGLVNSTAVVLKKQKQLVTQTEVAIKHTRQAIMIAWIIPCLTILGCISLLLLN